MQSQPQKVEKSAVSILKELPLDGIDPLSRFAQADDLSPPSIVASPVSSSTVFKTPYQPWSSRRNAILSRFQAGSEKLSIVTSFLAGGEIVKSTTIVSDKLKHRLEQLDNFDEDPVKVQSNLSQGEYVAKIDLLNGQLREAWVTDQRVKALKIVIQCSKLLSETSVMKFYPSKFVLITDILDIFGKLVYDRLKAKADVKLPDNFTADMVPETTRETCFNWFYKVASIRELLPRFYVETAIIRSYQFVGDS